MSTFFTGYLEQKELLRMHLALSLVGGGCSEANYRITATRKSATIFTKASIILHNFLTARDRKYAHE